MWRGSAANQIRDRLIRSAGHVAPFRARRCDRVSRFIRGPELASWAASISEFKPCPGDLFRSSVQDRAAAFAVNISRFFCIIAKSTGDLMLDFGDSGCSSAAESAKKQLLIGI
jgi:hypothetical protein